MENTGRSASMSDRVMVVFLTQVAGAVAGIVNGILLARLLGPEGKGDYYLLVLLPSTAMVLIQLGLPAAFGFFSARGQTLGLLAKALVLTGILSFIAIVAILLLLPLLQGTVLRTTDPGQVGLALIALPLALSATFTTGIVMGRQAVRWYAAVNIAYPVATMVLLIIILGLLGGSVYGALAVYLAALAIQAVGFAFGAARVSGTVARAEPVGYRELLRYGLPFYPAGLTAFFTYRADVYLIAWLIAEPSAALGFYSMAVGLAEMVFFFPNAVSSLFFPHVASSSREDSDRQAPMVARVTLLVTSAAALAMVPVAIAMIFIVLPAFVPSIPSLLILLPGVVALSSAKVLSGYIAGIRRPGINSSVSVATFVFNVALNLFLIPAFGIVGAALASLIAYAVSSLMMTMIAARLTGTRLADFWIPRASDVRFTIGSSVGILRRLAGRVAWRPGHSGT